MFSDLDQFTLQFMTAREDGLKLYLDIALAESCTARHVLLESLFCSAVAMVHIKLQWILHAGTDFYGLQGGTSSSTV